MNSSSKVLPSFGMNHQGFAAARPTCPEYDAVRKVKIVLSEKDRIIVASTCRPRRSVQFGCYITWVWMANDDKNAAFL